MSSFSSPGRRGVLAGGAAAAGLLLAGDRRAAAGTPTDGPWLVELFTSQGCSSCPPAAAYLGTLARRPDIVALSFHVDYWDYIGWKDTFATRATTDRQRAYARVLKQRYVYTPEMVIEGTGHDTGREPAPIERLLDDARRRTQRRATPVLSRDASSALTVALEPFALTDGLAEVTLALYDRRHATPIASGENQGRLLESFNVVRRLERLATWTGTTPGLWTVPDAGLEPGRGAAVIVQRADHGPVLGCNKLEPMIAG